MNTQTTNARFLAGVHDSESAYVWFVTANGTLTLDRDDARQYEFKADARNIAEMAAERVRKQLKVRCAARVVQF